MNAINESHLEIRFDSESTKRLHDYQSDLLKGRQKRLHDDESYQGLLYYAQNPSKVMAEHKYLDNLTDEDGRLYCRSVGRYSDGAEQLECFAKPEPAPFGWNKHYQLALRKVSARYAKAQIHMCHVSSTQDIMDMVSGWNTSAGFPKLLTGKIKKREYITESMHTVLFEKEAAAKRQGSFLEPYLLGVRTQGGGAYDEGGHRTHKCKMKLRFIFMDGIWRVISGRRFAKPINEWLRHYPYSNIGKTDEWTNRWACFQRSKGRDYLSLDYSKYDSTIPSWLIHDAFKVLRGMFVSYDEELLTAIEHDFIHKVFITGNNVLSVHHGNPSGSAFTAIINGICNELMTETWMAKYEVTGEYNIMGDDNLIYLAGKTITEEFLHDVSSYISHNFGIKVNADKSNFGTCRKDPEYLSRYWGNGGAWRPEGDVIALISYPERFRKHHGKDGVPVYLILYSYLLAYPRTMRNLIDVGRFMQDWGANLSKIRWTSELRENLPYNVRLTMEINGVFRRQLAA